MPTISIPIQQLKDNILALKELSLCLDRAFKHIQYWSHLAYVLKVDIDVIHQCEFYSENSPTIKLFKFLKATRPELLVKELKSAMGTIKRIDIYQMIKKRFKDVDKVSEVITDSSSEIMEKVAIKLDTAIKPTGNWKKLARQLKVPCERYKKFEMYSDYTCNPTISLVRYLYATSKEPIPLKVFMNYFNEMNRQDVIAEVKKVIELLVNEESTANKVLELDSDLLRKIADLLNEDTTSVEGWRELGKRFDIDTSILDSLEPSCDKEVHSSTSKVIYWLAAAKPSTTINDIIEALKKINRYDAIKILRSHFNVDTLSFSYDERDIGELGIVPDLGNVPEIDPNLDNINRRCTTPPGTPPFGIHATEQRNTSIFQEEVRNFGIPSTAITCIGRDEEKTELIAHLTRDQYQMVLLRAATGFGKTTLVINVSHEIIKDQYGYTVVYVDSKEVFSLNDLAYKILTVCGINSFQHCPRSQVIDLFANANPNCLLVIENLDHMYHAMDRMNTASSSQTDSTANNCPWKISTVSSKKEEFQHFLKDITTSAPNLKVLVTTWETVAFVSIKVKQMTLNPLGEKKSFELLKSRSDLALDDQQALDPIIKCCGGIPLLLCAAVVVLSDLGSVEASCKQFASSQPEKHLEFLSPDSLPNEERFNHCLGTCFDRMNVCSKKVLVLVSVFPNAFTLKEAELISKGISELKLEDGFKSLRKFSFLNPYDLKTESYTLHPAMRSFGIMKANEVDLKPVFEAARKRFIFYTFGICSKIEEEFFSRNCRIAIQKYRLQDESIREIARWCISPDSSLDTKSKQFCIESFLRSQFVFLKLMRSHPMKLILCKFAQLCQKVNNTKLYCECLTLGGAKLVIGCVCPPYLCQMALNQAVWCFCKVIEALEGEHSESTKKTVEELASFEVLSTIYNCRDISDPAKAQFLIKCGKCLVRHGYKEHGLNYIKKGINVRSKCYKGSPSRKSLVMLAVGYNDIAGACTYVRQHTDAISVRKKYVLPIYEKELGMHPFTATAQSQLARNYLEVGDYDKANNASDIALRYRSALLGDHQDTARSFFDKAAILCEQASMSSEPDLEFYEEALWYLQKAFQMQQRVLDSPEETAKTLQEIIFVLNALGRKKEAEQQEHKMTECVKKMEKDYHLRDI